MARYSRQREAILENLRGRYDHPTAAMVYGDIRQTMPNISLGTVYRNLTQLADDGTILRLTEGDVDHFDGCIKPHMHFCCDGCHAVTDISCNDALRFLDQSLQKQGYVYSFVNVVVHGHCAACLKKE